MSAPATREELLATAKRLREQAKRLRDASQWADSGQVASRDRADADDCIRRAEQMEKEAAQLQGSPTSNA